jgi:hypothetical protein
MLLLGAVHPWLATLFYADPGSGMLIWQLATAAVLGFLFYFRTILRRIRSLRRSREPKDNGKRSAAAR